MVVLVFLAQLSTTFISRPNLSCYGKASQWLACILLLASGIFLLFELRIKVYSNEDAAGLEAWRDRVIEDSEKSNGNKETPLTDDYLRNRLVWGLIESSKPRIIQSEKINKNKAAYLKLAYFLALAAFLLDILFMATITTHLL
jgi:hypothetical protein